MDLLHQEERKTGELDTRAERLPNPAFPVERTLPRPPGNGLTRSLDGQGKVSRSCSTDSISCNAPGGHTCAMCLSSSVVSGETRH
jgi:hypothetical protein